MSDSSVPPPDEPDLPSWITDSKARNEERHWDDEDILKGQRNQNELRWLKVYGYVVPTMMVAFSALYIGALFSYAAHYITPMSWLTDAQLSKIQSIIFSGSVGAFVASVVMKQGVKNG